MKTKAKVTKNSSTVVTALSIEPELLRMAKMKAELAGFKFSFSRYVCEVLRKEICAEPRSLQLVTSNQN